MDLVTFDLRASCGEQVSIFP